MRFFKQYASRPHLLLLLGVILSVGMSQVETSSADEARKQAIEVGLVAWSTDFDASMSAAQDSSKPVLVLFQEVPGCSGCKTFGAEVLSHPLIVEAIETEFIPVLVHNNRPGKDAALLKQFGEPAWNYQVIRFLDKEGKDVIPRKDKVWTLTGVAQRLVSALTAYEREIPGYLQILATDLQEPRFKQALFAQHCFWTGERQFAAIPGVEQTEAGFYQGREVTRVWYDTSKIDLERLSKIAKEGGYAEKVIAKEFARESRRYLPHEDLISEKYRRAPRKDQKRQLRGTPLAKVTSDRQVRTKLNAFVRSDFKKALSFLSPRQRQRLRL